MSKHKRVPDKTRLVESNPKLDLAQVERALRMVRELRASGHKSTGFRLAPPYSREHRQSANRIRERSAPRHRAW